MFGYIRAHGDLLQSAQKERYRALYCGLCRRLGSRYGLRGRVTLSYDMTFVAALLSSLYGLREKEAARRCPLHPVHPRAFVYTEATDYAADMNIVLAYYKNDDDWRDDRNFLALGRRSLLKKGIAEAAERWPRQCEAIEACLGALSAMEKENELNPDKPANCFGALMGEIFAMRDDAWTEPLRAMGAALGRFIYLMDARMDLTADIRRRRYNPLVAWPGEDFTAVLTALIGECTRVFESLPFEQDADILRNTLYAGVWVKYMTQYNGKDKRHERSL